MGASACFQSPDSRQSYGAHLKTHFRARDKEEGAARRRASAYSAGCRPQARGRLEVSFLKDLNK
ncbi:hypothetical protein COLO4_06730 [Corchorus olitorius]|uniref:Uncharacterized protein n=1 Tax=Corchorus olitorius TaxID=93759 RepID=A0A1R3KM81_9ROSI|nr:hypothetical protein COLO4_06730 [Corchorus olitorius]